MTHRLHQVLAVGFACGATLAALARPAAAQVTPAAGYRPPDDTPSVKLGVTLFADYTLQSSPEITDAAGNSVNPSAFQIGRTYLNVTGQVHHLLSFRITPDIRPETGTGSALNGSYTFRIKYAFAQVNLDDWMTRGSWVRLGMQQTPFIDYGESVYRYRFQGPIFPDREGYLSSSDAGLAFHTNFKNNYGDVHAGVYNGETYSRFETNDRKAFQIRGTLRPLPMAPRLRGLRVSAFYDADAPVKDGKRNRFVADASFEHTLVNAGFMYLAARDRALPTARDVKGRGFSAWVTPRTTKGWEGLLRYDHLEPDTSDDSRKNRTIAGVAYWLPVTGASAAFLLDYEQVDYEHFAPARPKEQRVALHCLVNF
jgi:hypothetical protein